MTTQAKIESNRRNARRSTGPRTREGKASSAKNSLRHGLLSKQITCPVEEIEAFTQFRRNLLTDLAPEGAVEELLAERIIVNAWRLEQAVQMVTARHGARMTAPAQRTRKRSAGASTSTATIENPTGIHSAPCRKRLTRCAR